jgi:outer membrane biosynthesis protein TonB
MRSSTILLTLGAALAVASPVHRALHQKKDLVSVWDIVTDYVYVTVTEDPNAPAEPTTTVVYYATAFVQPVAAATTSSTPPPPPPTTSSTPPPAPTTTVPPPPPAAPTTSTEAAPVVVPSPAPVVEAPTTTAVAAVASPTDYISTALYHHNIHRANHSSPAVTWDDTLAGYAAITAKTCVFAHDM